MIDPGIAGAVGAGIPLIVWEVSRAVVRKIGKASTLPKRMTNLESTVVMIAKETSVQTQALQATLEAVSGIKCNGNVEDALGRIKDICTERDEFYRKQAIQGAAK